MLLYQKNITSRMYHVFLPAYWLEATTTPCTCGPARGTWYRRYLATHSPSSVSPGSNMVACSLLLIDWLEKNRLVTEHLIWIVPNGKNVGVFMPPERWNIVIDSSDDLSVSPSIHSHFCHKQNFKTLQGINVKLQVDISLQLRRSAVHKNHN